MHRSPRRAGQSSRSCAAQDFFGAAYEWVERSVDLPAVEVEFARHDPDPEMRLEANLYEVTVESQGLDFAAAWRSYRRASADFDATDDPRLRWWYHHLGGILHVEACRFEAGLVAFERAITVAASAGDLEMEVERSKVNILMAYCRAGDAPRVAAELLKLVREKESPQLGPVFYQAVAYALHWLGEFEFAYSLRCHGMQSSNPTPARLARDHREFARILISLDRLDEAEFHLYRAMDWNPQATGEEATGTIEVAVEYAVARGDRDEALGLLESMHGYGSLGPAHERAIVAVAELLIDHGDLPAAEVLLDSLNSVRTTPSIEPKKLSLRAEIAAARGDHHVALELFRRAFDARELAAPPAETIVAICREITPWLSTTGPDSILPPVVESRFFDGSRWLMAAARDIRRSMAPSQLALDSDVTIEAKLDVLGATTDDLNLLGSFLADGAAATDARVADDFWALHSVVERVVERTGSRLHTHPEAGEPMHHHDAGLAGRMAFGLVAIVADHANPNSEIVLTVDLHGFAIEARAMTSLGLARVQAVLAQLCAPRRARNVILPLRASFVATYRAALSRGWSVEVTGGAGGAMTIAVVFGEGRGGGDERHLFAASPALIVEAEPEPKHQVPPSSDPELIAAVEDYHARRFEGLEFDLALVDAARVRGDVDLLASTLLVAASAELFLARFASASILVDELRDLMTSNPRLETELWPDPVFVCNREYGLSRLKGDVSKTWIAATKNMLLALRQDSSQIRMVAALNWATAEIERGALASAWLFSNMCDPTRTSEQGRVLELCVHNHVLVAEGRFDEAVSVAQERLALSHAEGFVPRASALEFHARTMSGVGRFSEAWSSVNEYADLDRQRQSPFSEALTAAVLWAEGRGSEAYAEAVRARRHVDFAFGAETLSITVPIEAEGLLASGEPEAARRLLDAFPVERQRYLDLRHRLDVEDRVAAALADHDRQIAVARRLFLLRSGVPRWDARRDPIYYKFWRTMEAAVRNDRQRVEAEQAAVVAVVTHDLRNSLTAVTLATELAAHNPDAEIIDRAAKALEPIRSLAGQLDAVAQWDGASRVSADDLVDIAELLDSIEFPNKSVYELSGGVLEVSSQVPDGLVVATRRSMLAIILRNLVGNAIKHGRRDGLVRVTATHHREGDGDAESVVITVDDDGPGLSPHLAARLREGPREPIEPSRGLGLWIVRRYAAALGLPVEVATSELGGTSVAVHLKVAGGGLERRGAVADQDAVSARARSARHETGGVVVDVRRQRVLVVEDDAMLSALVVELLVGQDKEVATAATASEAVLLLQNDTFDVILTDIDLADGSTGYDVLASVYEQGLAPEVVVMSGQAIDQTRIDLTRRFGTSVAVLQKPFTIEDLYVAVGS